MNTDHLIAENGTAQGSGPGSNMSSTASLGETAAQTGQQLKQKAAEATEQLKNKGSEALQQVRDQAREMATQQRDNLLDRLSHCSAASRRAAEQLRNDNDPAFADFADTLAGRIDQSSEYLRQRELSGMIEDTENFARRRPEIFFCGMFVAGLVLTRFMKASTRSEEHVGQPTPRQRSIPQRERHADWGESAIGGISHSMASASGTTGAISGQMSSQPGNQPTGTPPASSCGC